ncbi:MAG: undecaprenyl/decaprenyl-phosphate alpha-N-acetylglucosaminyl 1-phosphate transferase [Candidatus Muirbacterium halophilum]|nr:undecaprenyl/decaprenyl-phosphate alpha-N-acetylglucosaminyl 1-phosphate transferase [Candidatus Muirbacterium halophilum]MCK9477229.1 undecaprenyl/decaprenyl-phosphate alpha-N-acetylglucosaminyl 1-phosphate transferase [Candidatus Muirbacterium halophilum]
MKILVYLIGSFLLSFFIQKLSIMLCRKFELYDLPGERKVHTEPIPRLGGIGIFISVLIMALITGLLKNPELRKIIIASSAIFLLNLFDDLKKAGINNRIKLVFQIIISVILYYSGIKISLFLNNEILRFFVTIFWITGIMNSFNLIDNMNGLSSGLGIISSLFFSFIFFQEGKIELMYFSLVLACSLSGFLILNFPKARIFMGDCGANFLGFLLATISITGTYVVETRLTRLPVIAPLLILSVPIYDTLSVIIIRKLNGYSIFRPDTNHISHRLTKMGISQKNSVLVIFLISVIGGLGALMLRDLYLKSALILLFQLFIFYILITILVYAGKKN